MNTLVIIPSLHHKFSFSAPLAWIFSEHTSKVRGIYSEHLRPEDFKGIDLCIVEINWFIEIYEFGLIIDFIRKHCKECKILFGGLYGQIKYKEIFKRYKVDYFIRGFSELPMKMLLDGHDPSGIPNMVGRNFENKVTYVPSQKDLESITYNLDWFPDYFHNWARFPAPGIDSDFHSSSMPLFPSYNYPDKIKNPLKEFRVPPRGDRYHLPMIITARGRCRTIHDGCSNCMGSKLDELKDMYGCDGIVLSNDTVKKHLRQIADKFDKATLYINSPFDYDFRGEFYDLEMTIEFDCKVTPEQVRNIMFAFPKVSVQLVLNENGHKEQPGHSNVADIQSFLSLKDESHRIYFFAFKDDANAVGLPNKNRLYSEFVFPKWASWDYYTDWNKAMKYSSRWFAFTRHYNLLPFPRNIIMRIMVHIIFSTMFITSRFGSQKFRQEMLFGETT